MSDLATVTDLRSRKIPGWNPDTRRHAWQDIDEDGHHHKCVHCWVRYHHEPSGVGYVKVWDHGARNGRSSKSLGRCPGPAGRPVLAVVGGSEPASVPPPLAVAQPSAPVMPSAARACRRCNPPCGRPGRPYAGGPTCDETAVLVTEANPAYLAELRSATSGMGVPTWRGEVT